MKTVTSILISLAILLCTRTATADVCTLVEGDQAAAAKQLLPKGGYYATYCPACDQPEAPKADVVRKVELQTMEMGGVAVFVNGAAIDLAYTYIKPGRRWVNLGAMIDVNCSPSHESTTRFLFLGEPPDGTQAQAQQSTYFVVLRVLTKKGEPMPGAKVTLVKDGKPAASGQTGEWGSVSFSVPEGVYLVLVDDSRFQITPIKVNANGTFEIKAERAKAASKTGKNADGIVTFNDQSGTLNEEEVMIQLRGAAEHARMCEEKGLPPKCKHEEHGWTP